MATPSAEGTAARKRALERAGESEIEGPRKKKATCRAQSRKKRPGFDEEIFSETSYFIKNGLRYVKPYYFTFTTHAKGRWVGSTVYDVFCREFQAETPEYYEKAIKAGKVTVNGKLATMDTVINHNDLVCHRIHRHEPPVTAEPLRIVHRDENIVVLNKPASIPVHPCGRYRHNSVVFLLGKEHNLRNLHTVHRLDRLTSGLLMFARTVGSAQRMEEAIRGRRVAKVYLCRVYGEFPSDPIECSEPILVVSHKLGVCRVAPEGKPCATLFTRVSYNGKTSLVRCNPKTGRMHQIRVHLQWLGHPIVNDPLYNHPAWGPQRARQGEGVAEMTKVITEIVKTNYSYEKDFRPVPVDRDSISDSISTCIESTEPPSVRVCEASLGCSTGTEHSLPVCSTEHSLPEEPGLRTAHCPSQQSRNDDMEDSEKPLSPEAATVLPSLEVKPSSVETATVDPTSMNTTAALELQQLDRTCTDMRERESRRAGLQTGVNHCNQENLPARTKATGSVAPAVTGEPPAAETSLVTSAEEPKSLVDSPPVEEATCTERGSSHASAFPWQPPEAAADTDPDCTDCGLVRADPTPQELVMFLHALSYKGEDWEFSTERPQWASLDWQD